MPPSPPLRSSTVREHKLQCNYTGGHDFDSGLSLNAKDDDLTLFNEMHLREKDDFLLHSNDNFEDSFAKLGKKIQIRGESSNLLNTDSDKNDYDWLLTPPDTPLFPSLEDDKPPPTNLATRRRAVSQPTSVSRSSVVEKYQRPSRSSGSTHHRSPSPQPGHNTLQLRGRSLSAPHSRSASVLRSSRTPSRRPSTPPTKPSNTTPSSSTTSSRRPSTPPTKSSTPTLSFSTSSSRRPSTPATKPSTPSSSTTTSRRPSTPSTKSSTPRSLSPTPRRLSSTSSGQTSSSGIWGTSSIKRTCGGSVSPKLRGWQSNAPGFSLDTPPNLRTSLSGRPSSYSRGSSPASRSSKVSRRVSSSSSYSHDRNRFSPHSDGFVTPYDDNDIESLRHATVGVSTSPTAKKNGVFANNNQSTAFSKKASRIASPSPVSKRSFDSAPRHMVDHRKTPQNMFRPLMCSVPPSTLHCPIFSRNSSFTTSSNASYDLHVSVAPDAEGNDHDHVDLIGEWRKITEAESGLHKEIFLSDKIDEIREDAKHEIFPDKSSVGNALDNGTVIKEVEFEYENCTSNLDDTNPATLSVPTSVSDHYSIVYSDEMISICSFCGESFRNAETGSGSTEVCKECALKSDFSHANCVILTKTTQPSAQMEVTHHKLADATDVVCVQPDLLEFSEETGSTAGLVTQLAKGFELDQGGQQEVVAAHLKMAGKEQEVDKQFDVQKTLDSIRSISEYRFKHSKSFSPSLRSDVSEGSGISVPLKRSNSTKGDVVKGVVFAASNIRCAEPSYARENLNSIKLNYSRSSSTASSSLDQLNSTKLNSSWSSSTASSLDLGSSKRMEAYVQRQLNLNSRNGGMDSQQNHSSSKSHSCSSLLSQGGSVQNAQTQFEENHDLVDCEYGEEFSLVNGECCRSVEDIDGSPLLAMSMKTTGYEQDDYTKSCSVVDVTLSESSVFSQNSHSSPTSDSKTRQTSTLHAEINQTEKIVTKMEVPVVITSNSSVEDEIDRFDAMMHKSSATSLEMESHDNSFDLEFSHVDHRDSHNSSSDMESSHKQFVSLLSEKDGSVPYHELDNDSHTENIHEETTTVPVESSEDQKTRSLSWEEATDTVLFCSSIIQDLARKAAEIGAEKEQAHATPEVYQPNSTISQNPVSYLKRPSKARTKPLCKSQKIKKEVSEKTGVLPTESVTVSDVKESYDTGLHRQINSAKPRLVESKCNCTVM